jgi:hypothetical protein
MELVKNNHEHILGWGVDADKSVRPNYPMWKIPSEGTGAHWGVPAQQPNFKDFVSLERPGPTHVFGSTVPPSGLSGFVRKLAFKKFSEGHWEHWILLLMADRIGIVEGYIDDFAHGVRPKPLIERGWNVDKKFKTRRYKKVMTLGALAVVGGLFFAINKLSERPGER